MPYSWLKAEHTYREVAGNSKTSPATMSLDGETGSSRCQETCTVDEIGSNTEYSSDTCVICLEEYEPDAKTMNYHCGHIMHMHCTYEWVCSQFRMNVDITCPVCRFVQCHVNSPYYRRLKQELGITTVNDLPSNNNNLGGVFIHDIEETRIEIARVARQQQERFYRNQRGMSVVAYRIGGLLMCTFMILLVVFVVVMFDAMSTRD